MRIRLHGVQRLFRKLRRLGQEVDPVLQRTLDKIAEDVAKEAKRLVPEATGELKDSIHAVPIKRKGRGWTGGVDVEAEHAAFVEYGTSKMAAQPYLRPAVDGSRKAVESAVYQARVEIESIAKG